MKRKTEKVAEDGEIRGEQVRRDQLNKIKHIYWLDGDERKELAEIHRTWDENAPEPDEVTQHSRTTNNLWAHTEPIPGRKKSGSNISSGSVRAKQHTHRHQAQIT